MIKQFGGWQVTAYGIENSELSYYIDKAELHNPEWLAQIKEKNERFEYDNFAKALACARDYFGIKVDSADENEFIQGRCLKWWVEI